VAGLYRRSERDQEYHDDLPFRLMLYDQARTDCCQTSVLTTPSCSRVIRWPGNQGQLTFSEGELRGSQGQEQGTGFDDEIGATRERLEAAWD
jgi:hypothetical protein